MGINNSAVRLAKYNELPDMSNYVTIDDLNDIYPLIVGNLIDGNTVTFDNKKFYVLKTNSETNEAYLVYRGITSEDKLVAFRDSSASSYADAANKTSLKYHLEEFLSNFSKRAQDILIPKKYFKYNNITAYELIDEIPESKIFTFSMILYRSYGSSHSEISLIDYKFNEGDLSAFSDFFTNGVYAALIGNNRYTSYSIKYIYFENFGNSMKHTDIEIGDTRKTCYIIPCVCIPLDTPTSST